MLWILRIDLECLQALFNCFLIKRLLLGLIEHDEEPLEDRRLFRLLPKYLLRHPFLRLLACVVKHIRYPVLYLTHLFRDLDLQLDLLQAFHLAEWMVFASENCAGLTLTLIFTRAQSSRWNAISIA